jgi:cobalt-zinc-cadmium efflux system protein
MNPHPNKSIENSFILSMILTAIILVAEIVGGYWTGSLALLSDAAHVFSDILALGLSYLALRLSALPPNSRHSYGYHRMEVLAALVNGVSLVIIAIEIFSESWQRWQNSQAIKSVETMAIASIGLVVNLIITFVLGRHGHEHEEGKEENEREDLNIHSAFLHVLGDVVATLGVIVAAGVIWLTGWQWVDPLMSVFIGILILVSSWRVLKSSLHILVEGFPEGLSIEKVGQSMAGVTGVQNVHDLHVWSLCSGNIALSAHVVTMNQTLDDGGRIMAELKSRLSKFGIEHTTIQFECEACGQGGNLSVRAA